jgi:DsbC/DsbD-like thiol-disulfide interchange protein
MLGRSMVVSTRALGPVALLAGSLSACGGAAPAPHAGAAVAPSAPSASPAASLAPAPAASAAPEAPKEAPEPETLVDVSFEPLVTGVRPGSSFLLAAHFRIAPGYRVSWKAPGEVGGPTTVTFRAPPGFEVGQVLFPAPERFTAAGGYTGFGYERETALFVEVKAPSTLRRDDVSRFDLDAGWVACKTTCATERTSAFVELTTTSGNARAGEIAAALEPFRERIPKPLAELADSEQKWETSERGATLVVKLPAATPRDFFPDGTGDPLPTKTTLGDAELRFTYDAPPRAGTRPLRGVIAASVNGHPAFFDFEATLPESAMGAAASDAGKKGAKKPAKGGAPAKKPR